MDINLLFMTVFIITLIESIKSQIQIHPLFAPTFEPQFNKELNIKELNKLITIKPSLLRASSLTSLLKKPHLNLFNKPPLVTFLKVKNKKYLSQFLFGNTASKSKIFPTYQLELPIKSTLTPIETSQNSILTKNQKAKQFIAKPVFLPIKSPDNGNIDKSNSWNNLYLTYPNFNYQLTSKTNLPVFYSADSAFKKKNFSKLNKNENVNFKLFSLNSIEPNQNNNQNVNRTIIKSINYKPIQKNYNRGQSSAYINGFKPITSDIKNFKGDKKIEFNNKNQFTDRFKEIEQKINYSEFRMPNSLVPNKIDLESIILNTIEKNIKSKNLKFMNTIILPEKEYKNIDTDSQLKNEINLVDNSDKNQTKFSTNNMHHDINQVIYNQPENKNSIYLSESYINPFNNNDQLKGEINFKSQSFQNLLKLPPNSHSLDQMTRTWKEKIVNHNQIPQNQIKIPKFKVIHYMDRDTIEEFTKLLEDIDFKSASESDLANLSEFLYKKLINAKEETMTGHSENLNNLPYNNNQISKQISQPPFRYFTVDDNCDKNDKFNQINKQHEPEQQNYVEKTEQHNQQQIIEQPNQQYNQKDCNDQTNDDQRQRSVLQSEPLYSNNPQIDSINSLVNFDDQVNSYSTASTKLQQLKILPKSESNQKNNDQPNFPYYISDELNFAKNKEQNQYQSISQINNQPNRQTMMPKLIDSNSLNIKKSESNDQENVEETDRKELNLDNDTSKENTSDESDDVINETAMATSIKTDPTKLNLKIIHLPVSLLEGLTLANH